MLRPRRRRLRPVDHRVQLAEALRLARQALYAVRRSKALLQAPGRRADPLARGLEEAYTRLELLLERVALRLETMLYTGLVTRDLLAGAVEPVRRLAETAPPLPQLSEVITALDDVLSAVYASASEVVAGPPASLPEAASEGAEEVLRSAEVIARRRAESLLAGEDS